MPGSVRLSKVVVVLSFGCVFTSTGKARADGRDGSSPSGNNKEMVVDNRHGAATPTRDYEMDTPFAEAAPEPEKKRAQTWKPGWGAAFGGAWSFPTGTMSSAVNAETTLFADVGYWASPYIFMGGYLGGGYVLQKHCDIGDCTGWTLRGGPELIARFLPFDNATPWLGVGTGLESLWLNQSVDQWSTQTRAIGFEYVTVRLGADLRKNGQFFGAFLSYAVAQYTSVSAHFENLDTGATYDSKSESDPKLHGWLGLGIRGSIN